MHKNTKLKPPDYSAIQRKVKFCRIRDATALTGNVNILLLLHIDYLLFLKQPVLSQNFRSSLI